MTKKTHRIIVTIIHSVLMLGMLTTPVVRADTTPPGVDAPPGRSAMLQPAAIPTTQVTKDEEGYTLWTTDWGDASWCVPVSTLRYPFDLGTQDPTRLSDASLILEFSEGLYHPDVQDPSWTVALNGSPPDDWQSVGAISGPMSSAEIILNTAVIGFDALRLIDGENNIWLQQHDTCPQEPGCTTCACTCINLKRYTLRAGVDLVISKVSPEPDIRNVWPDQREDSEIRVKFTTLVSPTTVNKDTFQVYYFDSDVYKVYVDGEVKRISDVEYAFVPTTELLPGVQYVAQVWGENDARAGSHDDWVKDIGGGPLEDGRFWVFWTLPDIQVTVKPVQVLEGMPLVVNKPTVLRAFIHWDAHEGVFWKSIAPDVTVEDITLTWLAPGGTVWNQFRWSDGIQWQPILTADTARHKREYREFTFKEESYSLIEKRRLHDSFNYFGFTPDDIGTYTFEFAVQVKDNLGRSHTFRGSTTSTAAAEVVFPLHMRAVGVGPDYGKTGTVNLSKLISYNLRGMRALYPVPNVRWPAAPSAMAYYTPTTTGWTVDWVGKPSWPYYSEELYLLREMHALCVRTPGCWAMVGLVNKDWLNTPGNTQRESASTGALVRNDSNTFAKRYITAHEVGHLAHIDEHYEGPSSSGFDVIEQDVKNAEQGYTDFMTAMPEQIGDVFLWITEQHYSMIQQWIAAHTGGTQAAHPNFTQSADPLLMVDGVISPTTDTVILLPWYQMDAGDYITPLPGPYQVVFLDATQQEIVDYTRAFTVNTTLRYAGETLTANGGPAFFTFATPYPAATAKVQIRRIADAAVLAEITPAADPPTVTIQAPSDIWRGPQTLTWQTSPGAQYFAVDVSTDNGATWEAIALNLTAPAYTLQTIALPNTSGALIRVAASDGLRTATDVAGPFTIDNPPLVGYVDPPDSADNIGVWTTVVAGFRDAMIPTSINSSTFTLTGGPFGAVTGVVTYNGETREASFAPIVPLAYATQYTTTLTTGVQGANGESLPVTHTWTFTTAVDIAPPSPVVISPHEGAANVTRDIAPAVAWDRDLNASTLNTSTFVLATAIGTPVSGAVSYDAAARTATFTPASALLTDTLYIATLKAGIASADGYTTTGDFNWAFTVGRSTGGALAFISSYADWGHDTDGDGLYEYLVIRVGVQVTTTGVYGLKGVLNDSAGAEIAWASYTATLQPGVSFMPLAFDGARIGGHGVDGPYTLTGLTLSRVGTGSASVPLDHAMEVYQTFAYGAGQFPAPLRFAGLPDVLLRPGTALNPAFNARDYAHHALLDSAQLTYTLLSNDDLRAGVTLGSDGSLRVNPGSGWTGYSDVTLRAADGVLTVQDTFRVTVGWAYSLHLPVVLRSGSAASAVRSNWVVALNDDFEADGPWRYGSSISVPPGGWYYGGRRDCKAYSGQYSMWPFGDGEDGALLPCNSAYPNTLVSNMVSGISFNLEHTTQAELRMKVWTDLAPGDEICAMAALDAPVPDNDPRWLTYYGVCRSGTSVGWEDLSLDLSNVPVIGNLIGQEKIWIAVRFQANESESRPGGVYVDDVMLRLCPEGLMCDPLLGSTVVPDKPAAGSIGNYNESVSDAALAVEDNGRVHVAWTGAINPHFDTFAFYATSVDGVNWSRYNILNYRLDYEPQLAVDNTRHQAHLIYRSNYDGILHHTVAGVVVSDPNVLDRDGVTSPQIAVNPTTGYAYAVWHKGYYFPIGSDVLSWRRRLWYASWNGTNWTAPQKHVNDGDTEYAAIAASPDGGTMLAWFQQWSQSAGGATDPGDPIVPRTAYGTNPDDFPLRQAVSTLYEMPEKDNSILLTYSPGDQKYYLVSTHLMWPGHSRVYRYVWENGAWTGPLDVAENTAGWATAWYIGAAGNQSLITYVYNTDDGLYVRTETDGVLGAAQLLSSALAARGYTGSPIAFFVDRTGELHMLVVGAKDGVAGFYYVRP